MSVMGKIGVLALAGGMIAGLTSPSLAAWVVIQEGNMCQVVEEAASGGGQRVAGPYDTEAEAEAAKNEHSSCQRT
jgi:hypothetical protein